MKSRNTLTAVGLSCVLYFGGALPAGAGGFIWIADPDDANQLETTSSASYTPADTGISEDPSDDSGVQTASAQSQLGESDSEFGYSLTQQDAIAPYNQTALSISGLSQIAAHAAPLGDMPTDAQFQGNLGARFFGKVAYSDAGSQTSITGKLAMSWSSSTSDLQRQLGISVYKNGGATPIAEMYMSNGFVDKYRNGDQIGDGDDLDRTSGSDSFEFTDDTASVGDVYEIFVSGAVLLYGEGTDTMDFTAELDFGP
jgi:hypothetical protein